MNCQEKCIPGADLQLVALFPQGVEVSCLSAAVSHFLCCLLVPHFTPTPGGEDAKKKSRRRARAGASESSPWSTLTGAELWNLVCQDSVETYNISDCLGWEHSSLCLFSTHICFWNKNKKKFLTLIWFLVTALVQITWWSATVCRRSPCFENSVWRLEFRYLAYGQCHISM